MSKERNNDVTLKIFALIIAIILWSYVMSEVNPRITKEYKNIKVNFSNIESLETQGLVVMEPKEVNIRITIAGRRSDVIKVSEKDIIASVDLNGYKEGNVKVPVYIEVPNEVKIVDYSPKEILFKFDRLVRKESPVNVKTTGKLPEGYVLGDPKIKPQSVYIEGARSWVNAVSKVIALVDVTGKTTDISVTVPIKLVDDKGEDVRGVEKEQNVVDIFIPVYQAKKVPIELQTENQLPDNYEIMDINITPSTVELKGKKENLKDINSIKTKPVDINSLIGNKNVLVDLEIPEKVSLVEPNQKVTITLNIEENKTKTFNYTLNDVNIKNIGSGLSIAEEDLNKSFEITIEGNSSKVDLIEKGDLNLELDLSGLDEGSHQVNLNVRGEGIRVINIVPGNFSINLKKE
jgi:YbbR domain-containing protein